MTHELAALKSVLAEAMEEAWNEISSDTGCHPLDITRDGKKLWFNASHWVDYTAMLLQDRLDRLSAPAPTSEDCARINDRIAGISTPMMHGDNLAVILCSYFDALDDDGDEPDETGWSKAAISGYNEVIAGIKAHYAPLLRALDAKAKECEQMREALLAMLDLYGPPQSVAAMCEYTPDHPISLARSTLASKDTTP